MASRFFEPNMTNYIQMKEETNMNTDVNIDKISFGLYDVSDAIDMAERVFALKNNFYFTHVTMKLKLPISKVFDVVISKIGNDCHFKSSYGSFVAFTDDLFITVNFDINEYRAKKNNKTVEDDKIPFSEFRFSIRHRNVSGMETLLDSIINELEPFKTHSLIWAFMSPQGITRKQIFIDKQEPLIKELYPYLPTDTVQEYFKSYLDSPESILLLTGIPGTGKTTFIRNFISENELNAEITYDEALIKGDEYFLGFINDSYVDVLIIEDADSLLYDREKSDNRLLNKLLNVSDGIVKNVTKKIIFSTNITDPEFIDPALTRPGRCFDVVDFRKLTNSEAADVVKKKKLKTQLEDSREYTLAELFSTNSRLQNHTHKAKFGFGN